MRIGDWHVGEKYWKQGHGCWYCKLTHPDGRREDRRLGPDKDQADLARAEIVTAARKQGQPSADRGVKELCNEFLAWTEANNARKTLVVYKTYLATFLSSIPTGLRVRDLKLHHVQNWLKRRYPAATAGQNSRRNAITTLKRVFNWAANDMEYIERSPLSKLKAPSRVPRQDCPSFAQWREVLAHFEADDPFHDFLVVLLHTACRPQEARVLEARHIDWDAKKARLADGEVPGKPGERTIRLRGDSLSILRRWALKHPDGPLLRNEDGNPWTPSAINTRFMRLKGKLTFKAHAYLTRHSVATEMLEKGASPGAVAAVLGHKDATMVLKVYGKHIDQREDYLADCLDRTLKKLG
jgi:integrase